MSRPISADRAFQLISMLQASVLKRQDTLVENAGTFQLEAQVKDALADLLMWVDELQKAVVNHIQLMEDEQISVVVAGRDNTTETIRNLWRVVDDVNSLLSRFQDAKARFESSDAVSGHNTMPQE